MRTLPSPTTTVEPLPFRRFASIVAGIIIAPVIFFVAIVIFGIIAGAGFLVYTAVSTYAPDIYYMVVGKPVAPVIASADPRTITCRNLVDRKVKGEYQASASEFVSAERQAAAAWFENHDGMAADCVGTLAFNGWGVTQNYSQAIAWWQHARSAGINEDDRITLAGQRVALAAYQAPANPVQPNTAQASQGITAGQAVGLGVVAAGVCALIPGCTSAAWDLAKDSARSAVTRRIGDAALDAATRR